ncbi:4907_t:CDS:2, partial [Scutellospora calospora]
MVKFILFAILALLSLLSLFPSPSSQLEQFTYQDPLTGLDLCDDDKSNDGTIILRFGIPISQVNGSTTCWDKTIYLRIIHPNASISFYSISNHGIPDFNFCLKGKTMKDYTTIWGFDQGLILLTYYNSSNVTDSAIMGLIMTFEGTILSTIKLHDALINYGGIVSYNLVIPISSPSDGFLFFCRSASIISWVHFNAPDGEVIEITRSGIIQTNISIATSTGLYVLERGFAIAYGGDDSKTSLRNSAVDINNFNIGTTNGSYQNQTLIQTLKLRGIMCSVDFSGAGNICILMFLNTISQPNNTNTIPQSNNTSQNNTKKITSKKNTTNATSKINNTNTTSQNNITDTILQPQFVHLKISYLSSGSVTNIEEINGINFNEGFNLIPLRFGGYLMLGYQDYFSVFGYILDQNGNLYSNWSLPQPLNLPQYKSNYIMLANNSFVFVENQNDSLWNVTRDDLYRFLGQASTNPTIGSQVNKSSRQIKFTFTYPVILSNSNISIYQQIIGADDLLRQRFQGDTSNDVCWLDPKDNKTVIVQILSSTFNEPNGQYYVLIENNFVRRSDSNEALLGIDKNLWTL